MFNLKRIQSIISLHGFVEKLELLEMKFNKLEFAWEFVDLSLIYRSQPT